MRKILYQIIKRKWEPEIEIKVLNEVIDKLLEEREMLF
jgi:hypothetical protein